MKPLFIEPTLITSKLNTFITRVPIHKKDSNIKIKCRQNYN